MNQFLKEFKDRGYFYQCTDENGLSKKLNSEKIDITLPGKAPAFGSLHPITQVLENVIDIFEGYGFQTVEGPEVETNFYNFEAFFWLFKLYRCIIIFIKFNIK